MARRDWDADGRNLVQEQATDGEKPVRSLDDFPYGSSTTDQRAYIIPRHTQQLNEIRAAAFRIWGELSPVEKMVYRLRFEHRPPMTQQEVSEGMSITRRGVSHAEQRVLGKIKASFMSTKGVLVEGKG